MNAAQVLGHLDRLGFDAMRLLLSVLWQSSLLLAAVGLLALLLRRRRAAVRHALWAAAVVLTPAVPVLTWAASHAGSPQAPLPVVPEYRVHEWVPPAAPMLSAPAAGGAAALPAVPVSAPAVEQPLRLADYPWAIGFAAYVIGAGGVLALVAVGRVRLWRWKRCGAELRDVPALEAFALARDRLGLDRTVALIESPGVPGPLTLGTLHPTVLLPAGLHAALSRPELDAVAVHELAHVKRNDALTLSLVSVVRAVVFFHPLVWVAARQVAHLAEDAADDAVLEAGVEPVCYAKLLARMAEDLRRRAISVEMAAGFALTRGAFFRRIEGILSNRRAQIRRLTRAALVLTILGALLSLGVALALPLAERGGVGAQPAASRPAVNARTNEALLAASPGPMIEPAGASEPSGTGARTSTGPVVSEPSPTVAAEPNAEEARGGAGSFLAALQKKDFDNALRRCTTPPDVPLEEMRECLESLARYYEKTPSRLTAIARLQTKDDLALVEIAAPPGEEGCTYLVLARGPQDWRILGWDDSPGPVTPGVWDWIVGHAVDWQKRSLARGRTSSVHAAALAILSYRAEHDGTWPPNLDALITAGYLGKADAPWLKWPELEWHYQIPKTTQPAEVLLYHWPPKAGTVAMLFLDSAAMAVAVEKDKALVNPRADELIRAADVADGQISMRANGTGGPVGAPRPKPVAVSDDVLQVAQKMDDAVRNMLRQAVGRARFLARWEDDRIALVYDFYLDGRKMRSDQYVVQWTRHGEPVGKAPMERRAYDGELEQTAYWDPHGQGMRFFPAAGDNADWGPDRAYRPYGGNYTGVSFNPRGLYYPASAVKDSFVDTVREGAQGGTRYSLEGDPVRDEFVVLVRKYGDQETSTRWYVDVRAGYVITCEAAVQGGKTTVTSMRRYAKEVRTGATVLLSYVEPGPDGAKPRFEVELRYASVNQPISERIFTRQGLVGTLGDYYPGFLKANADTEGWLHETLDEADKAAAATPGPASFVERTYQVGDLMAAAPDPRPDLSGRAEDLMALIKQSCGGGTWGKAKQDGLGWAEEVKTDPGAIIIRQTPPVHGCIEMILGDLRSVGLKSRAGTRAVPGTSGTGRQVLLNMKLSLVTAQGEQLLGGSLTRVADGEAARSLPATTTLEYAVGPPAPDASGPPVSRTVDTWVKVTPKIQPTPPGGIALTVAVERREVGRHVEGAGPPEQPVTAGPEWHTTVIVQERVPKTIEIVPDDPAGLHYRLVVTAEGPLMAASAPAGSPNAEDNAQPKAPDTIPPELVPALARRTDCGRGPESGTVRQFVTNLQQTLPVSYLVAGADAALAGRTFTLQTTTNVDRMLDVVCELTGHGWQVRDGTINMGSAAQFGSPARLLGPVPAQLHDRLGSSVVMGFKDTPLRQAVAFLQRTSGIEFQVADAEGPEAATRVTVTAETSLEHAVNILCILTGYVWEVKDGAIALRPDPRPDRLPWRELMKVSTGRGGFRAAGDASRSKEGPSPVGPGPEVRLYTADHSTRLAFRFLNVTHKPSEPTTVSIYPLAVNGERPQVLGTPLQVLHVGEMAPGQQGEVVSDPLDLGLLPYGVWFVLESAAKEPEAPGR